MKRIFKSIVSVILAVAMLLPCITALAVKIDYSEESFATIPMDVLRLDGKTYRKLSTKSYQGLAECDELFVDANYNLVTDKSIISKLVYTANMRDNCFLGGDSLKMVELANGIVVASNVIDSMGNDLIESTIGDSIWANFKGILNACLGNVAGWGQSYADFVNSSGVAAATYLGCLVQLHEMMNLCTEEMQTLYNFREEVIPIIDTIGLTYEQAKEYETIIRRCYATLKTTEEYILFLATCSSGDKPNDSVDAIDILKRTMDSAGVDGFWNGLGLAISEPLGELLSFCSGYVDFFDCLINSLNVGENYNDYYMNYTFKQPYSEANVINSVKKLTGKDVTSSSTSSTEDHLVVYSIGTYKVTTTDGLNIRSGAGTSYSKVAAMPYLTQFIVTKVNGSWGYVTYGGRSGWTYLGGGYTKFVSSSTTPVSTTVGSAAVVKKIEDLVTLLNGKYFTTTQKDCGNNACAKCLNSNIIKTSWFKTLFGNIGSVYQFPAHWCADSRKYLNGAGYTCYGFATFAQWYIFKVNNTDYISDVLITQNAVWNYDNVSKYCKPGDVLRLGMSSNKDRHSAIFISCDSTGVNVLDCNYNGDCKVSTRKYYYTYWTNFSVSRASNYDIIANGDVEFTEPSETPGTDYGVIIPEDIVKYPVGWTKTIPEGESAESYMQSTFYRYRDVTVEESYGAWSEDKISTEEITESDLVKIVSEGDRYSYYHYCNNYYGGSYNVDSIPYGTGGVYHTKLTTAKMTNSNVSDKGGKILYGGEAEYACSNGFRVWAENEPLTVHTYVYKTRNKTENTVYSDWSDWSKAVPEEIEGREIESVVLYSKITDIEATYPEGWVKEISEEDIDESFESKTFYRYRTASPGFEYGSWSENLKSTEPVTESDTLEIVSQNKYYSYYHYCNNYYNGSYNVDSILYGTGGVYHTKLSSKKMTNSNVGDKGGKTLYGGEEEFACSNGFRVWAEATPHEVTEYVYRTRTKTETTAYTPWSDWSESEPELAENQELESVVLYKKSGTGTEYPKGWIKDIPEGETADNYLEKTFYRYCTTTEKTEYGAWSDDQKTTEPVTECDTLEIVSQNKLYSYYHYCKNYYNGSYNVDSIPYGTGGVYHTKLSSKKMTKANVGDKGGKTLYGGEAEFACSNGFRVWAEATPHEVTEYVYRTRTKTETTVYTPWSDWSETKPSETEDRVIESITLYTKWDDSVNVGTSLILDGSIGVRMYLDVADDVANGMTVNACVYDTNTNSTLSEFSGYPEYDSSKKLYYITAFVAPKDAGSSEIRASASYRNNSIAFGAVNVTDYISDFKKLAEGNDEFANGLELVESLEKYTDSARRFFNGESMEAVDVNIKTVTPPEKTGSADGVEHFATSLVLEGNTAIRHYFHVGDGNYVFKCNGEVLPYVYVERDTVYVDVSDIPAHELDTVYTVTVNDGYSVSYSVLNYVEQVMQTDNVRLTNLVKALYRYWQSAEFYSQNR